MRNVTIFTSMIGFAVILNGHNPLLCGQCDIGQVKVGMKGMSFILWHALYFCYAQFFFVHSTTSNMSRDCIHIGVCDHMFPMEYIKGHIETMALRTLWTMVQACMNLWTYLPRFGHWCQANKQHHKCRPTQRKWQCVGGGVCGEGGGVIAYKLM